MDIFVDVSVIFMFCHILYAKPSYLSTGCLSSFEKLENFNLKRLKLLANGAYNHLIEGMDIRHSDVRYDLIKFIYIDVKG